MDVYYNDSCSYSVSNGLHDLCSRLRQIDFHPVPSLCKHEGCRARVFKIRGGNARKVKTKHWHRIGEKQEARMDQGTLCIDKEC